MRYGVVLVALSLLLAAIEAGPALAGPPAGTAEIRVLSNRADLISGGDALVELVPPPGVSASRLRVDVNGGDVSSSFAVRPNGRYMALLGGLRVGANVVSVRPPGRPPAQITIINHPIGGPVLSGPQIQPWTCFPGAIDAQCDRTPAYQFSYKSRGGGPLLPYDPSHPPPDVATTTTDQGKRVPFVVRQETGELNRDEYRIAVLYDPTKPWAPWAPQDGFNHKLVITHGASCETEYKQASAPSVLNETALSRGFAVMSHALDNAGHNCNIATEAESLIMTKERVIEQYGELRYTIGSGCSGGSLVQQQVANAYPGLYQGITPACSFTDAWSSAMQYVDYQLLRRYFENPAAWAPGVAWAPTDIAAVEGHPDPLNAVTFTSVIPSSGNPSRSCPGVPADQVYNAKSNPHGVRCSLQDYMVNVFGRRPEDGFAGRPYDNVGTEYGRKALLTGKITPAQFVDINSKLGSFDIDYNRSAERATADRPALARVYRSGAVNQADNLDKVPIIDLRGPDPGAFHDVYRTYVMRARLDREHGTHANQILWRGQAPIIGDGGYTDQAILAMDQWLGVIEKDLRNLPLSRKVLEDKPASVHDRCTDGSGQELAAAACDAAVQAYTDPRIESGMPFTDDTIKCALKPLVRSDYLPVQFNDAQWSQLGKAFPSGVCDYAKPGVDRGPTVPWLTYARGPGGQPLGTAPASRALAPCTARSAALASGHGRPLTLAACKKRGSRARTRRHGRRHASVRFTG